MAGRVIPWKRARNSEAVKIGQTMVKSCDIAATNGIVHVIEGYLIHRPFLNPIDWDDFDLDEMFDWFD